MHGEKRSLDQCENAIQMSAGYKEYAQATLDMLNTFEWKTIALVFDGKYFYLHDKSLKSL